MKSQFSFLIKPSFQLVNFKHAYLLPAAQILITVMDERIEGRNFSESLRSIPFFAILNTKH